MLTKKSNNKKMKQLRVEGGSAILVSVQVQQVQGTS